MIKRLGSIPVSGTIDPEPHYKINPFTTLFFVVLVTEVTRLLLFSRRRLHHRRCRRHEIILLKHTRISKTRNHFLVCVHV